MLDHNSTVMLANSLVSSRLDFCNSLFAGIPKTQIHRLQLVQNSLVCAIFLSVKKRDHISSLLRSLHWLPIEQRISFKTSLITFKTLQYGTRLYLAKLLSTSNSSRSLRSGSSACLFVPRVNSSVGQRSFHYYAPTLWNSLPPDLRSFILYLLSDQKLRHTFSLHECTVMPATLWNFDPAHSLDLHCCVQLLSFVGM